MRCK